MNILSKLYDIISWSRVCRGSRPITVSELRDRIGKGKPTLVLDIRSRKEQAVSIIPYAVPVDIESNQKLEDIPEWKEFINKYVENKTPESEDAIIVVYCSCACNSSKAAAKVCDERLKNMIYYLEGGIIAWVNEGGSLVDPKTRSVTKFLHPGTKVWRWFVTRKDLTIVNDVSECCAPENDWPYDVNH